MHTDHPELGTVFKRLLEAVSPATPHLFAPDPKSDDCDEDHRRPDAELRPDHAPTPFQTLTIAVSHPLRRDRSPIESEPLNTAASTRPASHRPSGRNPPRR